MDLKRAEAYLAEGSPGEAQDICRGLLDRNPFDGEALRLFAKASLGGGNDFTFLESLMERTGFDFGVSQTYGFLLAQAGEADRILQIKHKIDSVQEANWQACWVYSGVQAALGDSNGVAFFHKLGLYLKTALDGVPNAALTKEVLARQSDEGPGIDESLVCFSAHNINGRVRKIAHALKQKGIRVRLVLQDFTLLTEDDNTLFEKIEPYAGPYELWRTFTGLRPLAVHVFCHSYRNYSGAFVALLLGRPNVVVDFYDVFHPSQQTWKFKDSFPECARNHRLFRLQRFIYDHIPGLCLRVLYSKLMRSSLPRSGQKRLYLPEMAWGRTPKARKLSQTDNELHVVHGSGFPTEADTGIDFSGLLWLAGKVDEFKIHLHIYTQLNDDRDLSDYTALAERSRYLHLHDEVPYDRWLDALEQYDVGLMIIHPREKSGKGKRGFTELADISGTWANKVGDYVDAGLYVVCSWRVRPICYFVKRYKLGEAGTPEHVVTREFWDGIKRRVIEEKVDLTPGREAFAMGHHGDKLIGFYRSLKSGC